LVEAISNVGVDVFVLISGWFGIKARLKGFGNVLFQPFFYSLAIIILFLIIRLDNPLAPKSIANLFLFTKNYWFIKAYLGLYILSPVLNSFVERASKRQFEVLLLFFFGFQTIYGWTDSAADFHLGFSIISFCGLYLLARYASIYRPKFTCFRPLSYLGIFLLMSILIAILSLYAGEYDGSGFVRRSLYAYIDPLIIVSSLSLLLLFSKLRLESKAVNWAAASCLSLYLITENINVRQYYLDSAHSVYTTGGYFMSLLLVILFILAVSIACIMIDQLRKFVWSKVSKLLPDITFDDLSIDAKSK